MELSTGRIKNADEFERKYSNVALILEEWGIKVEEEARLTEVQRRTTEFQDTFSSLNRWFNQQKPPETIEHDVFMLQHIRRLRGSIDRTPGSTTYWFITYDRGLTRYSAQTSRRDYLPACLLADDWLQITRPFLSRTDDYERSFVAMLSRPVLHQQGAGVPYPHLVEALERLEQFGLCVDLGPVARSYELIP